MRNRGRRRKWKETYKQGAEARQDPRREQPRSLETVRRVPEVLAEGEWSRCHVARAVCSSRSTWIQETKREELTKGRRCETAPETNRNQNLLQLHSPGHSITPRSKPVMAPALSEATRALCCVLLNVGCRIIRHGREHGNG